MNKKKGFIWQWNLLYFILLRWENRAQKVFNYPLFLILKIKFIRNLYAKRGVNNPEDVINNALNNPATGTNSIIAGIHMGILIFMLQYSIFNLVQIFVGKSLIQYFFNDFQAIVIFLILFLSPAGILNYFVLFKNDRYLSYFKSFNKFSKSKLKQFSWRSFFVIMSFWILLILSFVANIYFI